MRRRWTAAALGLAGWFAAASAGPAVVADSACPRHAIDIEAFATCEGDRVAAPETEATRDNRSAADARAGDSAQGTDPMATGGGIEQSDSVSVARADGGRP